MGRPPKPVLERLMKKVTISASGCWEYSATRADRNYRQISVGTVNGRPIQRYAHRVAWEQLVGPIPEGLQLDHLCRNRICVNPEHLEPVTARENTRRATSLISVCPAGHPYDRENTRYYRGRRYCGECKRIQSREKYWKDREPFVPPDHCPQGHRFTPENTRLRTDGKHGRECKECNRIRTAKWKAARAS